MKLQPSEKVSVNSHEITSTQNAYLPVQNCLSNLTNNNSNLHQVRINNPSRIRIQMPWNLMPNVIQDGHVFSSPISFHSNKKTLALQKNTLMKFSTCSMERLENKIQMLINEDTLLKQEVKILRADVDFQNKWFEEAKRERKIL